MTLDDFTHLLDRCGADPAAWPFGAEAGVRRLLSVSAEARAEHAAARALDELMAATRAQAAPWDLAARASVGVQARRPGPAAVWARAAGVAAAAAVTLSLGLATGAADRAPTPDQAVAAALGAPAAAPAGPAEEPGDAG